MDFIESPELAHMALFSPVSCLSLSVFPETRAFASCRWDSKPSGERTRRGIPYLQALHFRFADIR